VLVGWFHSLGARADGGAHFDTIIVGRKIAACAPSARVKQIKRVFPTKAHKEQSARGAEQ